ncbi:ABC transporter substrate-binding protein [Nesterenkonia alkaliphila]|uniref:ABC transporter substrate-binding protein n=1 Tax=Nesterenkonia alkaliphila TaxID=1463631 RepID=A0A7K1UJC6_9MICC|nr:ABC transporter substrate-binding protein [Nesterenkonia alkaliphila]MVT26583.1 ABC transporter substrate-binding protein [Nesterenkonia alkaliphila]GFZ78721.1 peptide ABC transporter substrate-binding protein [Nesterenkonia alkaliphila]
MRYAARTTTGIALAALVLTACGGGDPDDSVPESTDTGGGAAAAAAGSVDTGMATGAPALSEARTAPSGEAPDLAELVEAGELPPVAERVPEEAVTIIGKDGVGQYGGELQMAMNGNDDDSLIRRYAAYEPMVRWDGDWSSELTPGVAREWEVSEDATAYTFHLEEGIRWSDGEPFTADDIVFGYEDVLMNEELTPGPTEYLMDPEGNWPEITTDGDYTVTLQFEVPHGLFLYQLARAEEDGKFHRFPRHYLEQFHIDYNEDAVQLAADEGTRVTAVRNPYYWKVDEEGNQLPYIDRLVFDVFDSAEVIAFRAAAGNISYQDRHFDHDFRPLLAESMEEYNFSLIDVTSTDMNTLLFNFNHIHPDEELREVFTDLNFKAGLSHAMNREEIIELVYFGQGEPSQAAPREGSPYYHEELATQYLEFDLDTANEYLNQVLPEKDQDGNRLGPDGNPFTFTVDVATDRSVEHARVLELVQAHWAEVGITMDIQAMDRDLRNERRDAGEFDVYVRDGSAGLQDAILRPHWYMPFGDSGAYAWSWGSYYLDGEDAGEAPPEDSPAWRQWEIYDEILVTADPDEQARLMEELLDVSAEAFWTIGLSTSPNRAGVVHNDLRNAPHEIYEASAHQNPGPSYPAVWWWENPEDAVADDEDAAQDYVDEYEGEELPGDE